MYDNGAGKFPTLKGKGAEIRHLAGPLLETFCTFMDSGKKEERLMKVLLSLAARMEWILDEHADEYKLPAVAAKEFKQCTQGFFQVTTTLGHLFAARGVFLFKVVIKFHYLLHLGLVAEYINPRLGWCYAGEDFMHRIKSIAQASQSGTAPSQVVGKIMSKYCRGLAMGFLDNPWRR